MTDNIQSIGKLTDRKLWEMHRWAREVMTREPDQRLEDGDKGIYLKRWYAVPQNPAGGVYVHEIIRDDKDVMHDHPWDHTSIIVAGEYDEETPDGVIRRRTGEMIHRPAARPHRLLLPQRGRICVSIVFTGFRFREWGFHCPGGWVDWRDFTMPGDEGQVGRGCGDLGQA